MNQKSLIAEELNRLAALMPTAPGWLARPCYAPIADAIYWTDEIPDALTPSQDDLIRVILRYRTSLIVDNIDQQWLQYWEEARRQFPDWVGFSADRVAPNPPIIEMYRRESQKFDAELEEWISEE